MFPATELNLHLVRGLSNCNIWLQGGKSIDILLLYNYPISNIKKNIFVFTQKKQTSSDLIEVHHQRLTHRLHVWYIYLHLGDFVQASVGTVNIPYMEHMS